MIDVFNYNVEDLIKIKKRYIILGIAFFVIGFVVSLLLLLLPVFSLLYHYLTAYH